MTTIRQIPWDGPELELIEPGAEGYAGNPIFGGRWDAPIADEAPVYAAPIGARCYDCCETIARTDRGSLRGGMWSDPDRPGEYVAQTRPIHFECDMLGIIGCLWGICHCREPRDTQSGQAGVNIDQLSRRVAARLLLERINADRATRGQRPM